jgi:hypothetical protein
MWSDRRMEIYRRSRTGWRLGRGCLVAGITVLLASAGAITGTAYASANSVVPPPVFDKPCVGNKVVGPFAVAGTQVFASSFNGQEGPVEFNSYGPTVAATLDVRNWKAADAGPAEAGKSMDEQEMAWAAADWCANTVRIQVNQDLLYTRGLGINQSYLNAIEAEVTYAEKHQLVVVLNDSTESSANSSNELGPTLETFYFWLDMARIYGHGSGPAHVIFDLFNEPRDFNSQMSPSVMWNTWFLGTSLFLPHHYMGMEFLAEWVRGLAPQNLLWIEGPNFSDSFAGMHPHYMITVNNVVYAIHHPLAIKTPTQTLDIQKAWDKDFGYLVEQHIAPVVEGEWTNRELRAGDAAGDGACWPDAIKQVPAYLKYLAGHHIGMSAYTLNYGFLLRQLPTPKPDPLEPTQITSSWNCVPGGADKSKGTEGAGQDIYKFFSSENLKHAT